MKAAIHVQGLWKEYQVGIRKEARYRYDTLHDAISRSFHSAWQGILGKPSSRKEPERFWALREVSFDVQQGEIVGIIGRNGAGKSTLLKILSRITEPTKGYAELRGRVASLLEVGTGFHQELTGRENLYLNGTILGMKTREIDKEFDQIVSFAEIEKFIDTPVKHYSSGMRVRLAFAVAAHLNPEILLVDEVLAVGDADFQKRCLGKMEDIRRQGRTVLLVSHNMANIINLCQRALLLNAGELVSDGRAMEVVQQYLAVTRSEKGEKVWSNPSQAPGNDLVRLHAVRVLQEENGGPTADVDISRETLLEISYWNLKEGIKLYPAIWLRDQMGTVVLSSGNHTSISLTADPWYGRPHPRGLFRSVCRLPSNFLNEGLYSFAAIVGKGISDTQILQDYALSFYVHDTGEMRKEYFGHWIGTVRPRLAWHTEYVRETAKAGSM